MKTVYIYITEKGQRLAERISEDINGDIFRYGDYKKDAERIFTDSDALVFIMASGIAVRSISPYLKNKFEDPAVIVMDECGKNVISLLGGHMGGANELACEIADITGANPVITTATDVNDKGAFDMIVKRACGYVENLREKSLEINSMILKERKVYIYIDRDYRELFHEYNENVENRYKNLLKGFITVENPDDIRSGAVDKKEKLIILSDKIKYEKYADRDTVLIVPRRNMLGVGCKKNTDSLMFEQNIVLYLIGTGINIKSICMIGSIDLKRNERCILDFSEKYNIETRFFSSEELSEKDDLYSKSEFVKKNTGVYSVAEPSCDLLSGGNIINRKFKGNGITISVGRNLDDICCGHRSWK